MTFFFYNVLTVTTTQLYTARKMLMCFAKSSSKKENGIALHV